MTDKKDPYASEAESRSLLVPDTRTAAERKLAQMLAERGADEQGAEAYPILWKIAVDLLAEQPAQQINQETRTKDGLKYSPNYVAGYNDGLKSALAEQPAIKQDLTTEEPVGTVRELFKLGAWENLDVEGSTKVYLNAPPAQRKPLPPVYGDLLPSIGSQVLIHLASQDKWVAHTVVGYYVWGAFDSDMLHRVYVRVQDSDGILNARMLRDVRPIEAAHGIKENT